jgi:hypothetical protein
MQQSLWSWLLLLLLLRSRLTVNPLCGEHDIVAEVI